MEKKVLSSLVLSGAMMVMAPQAWAQTGGSAPGSGKSGSEPQVQKPSDPPMSGQQRGSSGELQSERSSARAGAQAQRAAGQQRLSKDQVKQIQEALKDKGQNPGEADGIMGPKTQQALRDFQKSQNLQVTGRVDEKTASALGVDVSPSGAGSSSSSGMGSSREPSGATGASGRGSASDKASSSKGASGSSSDLGTSSGASSKSGSVGGTKGNNPDITEPKKGSTAGRQESTDANPK
jgi:hypothetical protein